MAVVFQLHTPSPSRMSSPGPPLPATTEPVAPPAQPVADDTRAWSPKRQRRARRSQLQKATEDLNSAQKKLDALAEGLAAALAAAGAAETDAVRERRMLSAELVREKHTKAAAAVAKLQAHKADVEAKDVVKQRKEAAKRARHEQALEQTRAMSDDGVRILCRLRLNYQNRFDNKSDKNENIWKHLEVDFNAKIRAGGLPASDMRSLDSLKSKFSKELCSFKQYCALRVRAAQSGADAEAVGERSHCTACPCMPALPCPVVLIADELPVLVCRGHRAPQDLHHRHLLGE